MDQLRDQSPVKVNKIPTFSEVCQRGIESEVDPAMIDVETLTDMSCQGLQSFPSSTMAESANPAWKVKSREYRCTRENKVTCGMLPTLRALASRGCNDQGSICMVPLDVEMDAASHLQMILLEAYCREIGIRVSRVPLNTLRDLLGPGHTDLSCVLIDDPYFLDPPE